MMEVYIKSGDIDNLVEQIGTKTLVYGNVGWDCAVFDDDGLRKLISQLKELKPELF